MILFQTCFLSDDIEGKDSLNLSNKGKKTLAEADELLICYFILFFGKFICAQSEWRV